MDRIDQRSARSVTVNRRIDLNDIRLLMQVVEHGSYTATARAIGVPKSTIGQRIAQLEAAVGTGLLRRTSRSLSLTEAGTQLLPHARTIDSVARQVETTVLEHSGDLQGTLRINCSHAFAQFALSPILPLFLNQHPKVTIKIEASNALIDLVSDGFDMTVRGHVGPLKDSSLIRRVVVETQWVLAASPDWLAAHKAPTIPSDLTETSTLCFTCIPDWRTWVFRKGDEERRIEVTPRVISDDMLSLRMSAISGVGVVCLPSYVLDSAFDDAGLVELMPDWTGLSAMISVLTPPRLQSSRLAGAFSAFLGEELPKIVRYEPGSRPTGPA